MNLREGTRRLALLLGAVGAIAGGFASYIELHSVLGQRARHNRFEQLANSDVVQQERVLLPRKGELSKQDIQDLLKMRSRLTSGDMRIAKIDSLIDLGRFQFVELPDGGYGQFPADAKDSEIAAAIATEFPQAKPWLIYQSVGKRIRAPDFIPDATDKWAKYAVETETAVSEGSIKTIHWDKNYAIESIETEDGQTLYPTPAPANWNYFLVALFPILGFFILWAAIRAIGWVGIGFGEDLEAKFAKLSTFSARLGRAQIKEGLTDEQKELAASMRSGQLGHTVVLLGKAILRLDRTSSRLAIVGIVLTIVVVITGIIQTVLMLKGH